ncbi:MAG TPA: tetratricopeptide repeat protein [bacterium]|nr:tetratricopeptide repeat protein [bacterium]HQL64197.1 tetratricopeptide repeat protein [bacterium]
MRNESIHLFGLFLLFISVTIGVSRVNADGVTIYENCLRDETLDKILALPPEKIDIVGVALSMSKSVDPNIDIITCLKNIESMADEVYPSVVVANTPEAKVRALGQFLFEKKGLPLCGNYSVFWDIGFHRICLFQPHAGNCFPLSLLYIAIGQRIGLPFSMMHATGHVMVAYDDGTAKFYIETTEEGKIYQNASEVKDRFLDQQYCNVDNPQIIALLLNNIAGKFGNEGRYDEAIRLSKKATVIWPDFIESYWMLGSALAEIRVFDQAIESYRKAIELRPHTAEPHNQLGIVFRKKGDVESAIAQFQEALSMDPKSSSAHFNLAVIAYEEGKIDEAIAEYLQAIDGDPNNTEAHNNLGYAYELRGDLDKAIVHYHKALEIDSGFSTARRNLSRALRKNGQSEESPADTVRQRTPEEAERDAYFSAGITMMRKGQIDEAIVSFQKALEIDPNDVQARDALGYMHEKKGELDAAMSEFERVLEIDPNYVASYVNLGYVYKRKGNLDKAIELYEKAISLDKSIIQAYHNLAAVLWQKKEYDKAWDTVKRIQEMGAEPHPILIERLKRDSGRAGP